MDVGKRETWEQTNRAKRQNFVHVWFRARHKRTGASIDYMAITWEESIHLLRKMSMEQKWGGSPAFFVLAPACITRRPRIGVLDYASQTDGLNQATPPRRASANIHTLGIELRTPADVSKTALMSPPPAIDQTSQNFGASITVDDVIRRLRIGPLLVARGLPPRVEVKDASGFARVCRCDGHSKPECPACRH